MSEQLEPSEAGPSSRTPSASPATARLSRLWDRLSFSAPPNASPASPSSPVSARQSRRDPSSAESGRHPTSPSPARTSGFPLPSADLATTPSRFSTRTNRRAEPVVTRSNASRGTVDAPSTFDERTSTSALMSGAADQSHGFDVLDGMDMDDETGPLEEEFVVDDEACFVDDLHGKIDFLSSLPHELSLYILLHLDFRTLLQTMAVSKQWCSLTQDNLLWRDLFHQQQTWRVREEPSFDDAPTSSLPTSPSLKRTASASGALSTSPTKRTALDVVSSPSRITKKLGELVSDLSGLSLTSTPSTSTSSTAPSIPAGISNSDRDSATTPAMSSQQSPSQGTSLESSIASLRTPSRRTSAVPPQGASPYRALETTPISSPSLNWPKLYKDRFILDQRWTRGAPRTSMLRGHTDSVYCLQFDHSTLMSGSRDRTIRVWDLKTLTCSQVLKGHEGSVLCVQFDEKILVSGSSDCRIFVWDLVGEPGTGKGRFEVQKTLIGHNNAVLDLSFDDKWIVSCSKDTTVRIWSRESGELFRVLSGHGGPVNAIQLLGNKVISASGDSLMKLWDIDTGDVLRVFTGHERGLACVQASPSGKLIVTGSNDKAIKVWDAETGACLRTMEGHTDLVRSLAFDETRRRVVSASYDRTLRVWDLDTGALLLRFKAHTSLVFDVAFSASKILSCSHDQKIMVLDFGVGLDVTKFL